MNIEDPRIQLYIDNEMSEVEKIEFEKEMVSFPEIQEYINFKKFIIEGIQSEGDEELKEYIRTRVQDEGSENQTNLWLYAVATVTVVLVSYFFIIQYIKTGSIQEASKVLVLNEPTLQKEKYKTNKPSYLPNSLQYDSSIAVYDSTSTVIAMNENDAIELNDPGKGEALSTEAPSVGYQWDFGDSRKDLNLDKEESIVHQSNLVPIKLAMSNATEEEVASDKSVAMTKMNRSAVEGKSKKEGLRDKSIAMQDTVTIAKNNLSDIKKSTIQTRKFSLYFIQNTTGKPSIEIIYKDGIAVLKLLNLDSENPLIYLINDKYYLELGAKTIYLIPQNSTNILSPKPITDKALIQAIQN
jgi:hypothetical protein